MGSDSYAVVTTDDEYDNFVNYIRRNNSFEPKSEISFDNRDSILTMSTCSGSAGGTQRFVVHSVKNKSWDVK